jgi:hypothetical protein
MTERAQDMDLMAIGINSITHRLATIARLSSCCPYVWFHRMHRIDAIRLRLGTTWRPLWYARFLAQSPIAVSAHPAQGRGRGMAKTVDSRALALSTARIGNVGKEVR